MTRISFRSLGRAQAGPLASSSIYRRKDGSTFPTEVRVGEVTLRGQKLNLAAIRDITERQRSEEALKESEEKYRSLIETTDTGFLILDSQGKVIDANKEYIRLSGHISLEEILGKRVVDWTAAYDRERNRAAVITCLQQGYVRGLEFDYVDAGGRITPVEINATVISTGKSSQIVSLCRDITERKKAEEALQAERQRLFRLLDGLQAYIYLRRADYSLVYANKYFRERFGDPANLPCFKILHNRHKPCEGCPSEKVFATGAPQEWEWTSSDGRTYRIYDYPFADVDGTPLVLEMGLDVTQHKLAEEGLRASERALRQNQEKYRMLAGYLLNTQEAERKRLARELHDDLSQRLAGLAMEAENLECQTPPLTGADPRKLKKMKNKLVELSIDVHAMSRRLHPSILDDLGLTDAVESECTMFRKRRWDCGRFPGRKYCQRGSSGCRGVPVPDCPGSPEKYLPACRSHGGCDFVSG